MVWFARLLILYFQVEHYYICFTIVSERICESVHLKFYKLYKLIPIASFCINSTACVYCLSNEIDIETYK